MLQGLRDDATLLRSMKLDGRAAPPGPGGVVLTHSIAAALQLQPGDSVVARSAAGGSASFRVDAFADATLGEVATARRDELAHAFGIDRQVTSAVITLRPPNLAGARRAVSAMPDAAYVEDVAQMRDQLHDVMALGWFMVLAMLLCSVVLAAAILFNTATLGILERRRELATLRALGRTVREIALGLTLEHGLLCIAGLALGLPLSIWAIRHVLALYSSDLFRLPFVLSPATVATAASGIIIVLLLAQWPALRQVARESLADAVRTREG